VRKGGREGGRERGSGSSAVLNANTLPSLLPSHSPQVAVIVMDSIALPFRQDKVFQTESAVAKARVVNIMARELNALAKERNVAVRREGRRKEGREGRRAGSISTQPEAHNLPLPPSLQVVVTNQMTTKVDDAHPAAASSSSSSSSSLPPSLAPTLGDSWAPAPAVRLLLWTNAVSINIKKGREGGREGGKEVKEGIRHARKMN